MLLPQAVSLCQLPMERDCSPAQAHQRILDMENLLQDLSRPSRTSPGHPGYGGRTKAAPCSSSPSDILSKGILATAQKSKRRKNPKLCQFHGNREYPELEGIHKDPPSLVPGPAQDRHKNSSRSLLLQHISCFSSSIPSHPLHPRSQQGTGSALKGHTFPVPG